MIASTIVAFPRIVTEFKVPTGGFAIGAMIVSISAAALGDVVGFTKEPFLTFDFGTALFAGLSGLALGGFWRAIIAGELPMPIWRALFLGGAVSLSISTFAAVFATFLALGQMRSGIVGIFLDLLFILLVPGLVFLKFAPTLITLMVGWALVWRVVVNASAARRATVAETDAGKSD